MPGPVFVRGDRVDLHPIEEADLPFLAEQMNDPDVWRTLRTREPKSQRTEREWWEGLDERDGVTLLVVADGEPVGNLGYGDVDESWGTAEVGYAVHPDHRGDGYATEAVALLTRFAFEERRLEKLVATVYEHSPPSTRVLEKADWAEEAVFEREAFVGGERVDLHRFAAHADAWTPPDDPNAADGWSDPTFPILYSACRGDPRDGDGERRGTVSAPDYSPSSRPRTTCCISLVPSPISMSLASR